MQNCDVGTLKIDQSTFIDDLFKENLTNCNSVNILIKVESFIEMLEDNNYEKTDIKISQYL